MIDRFLGMILIFFLQVLWVNALNCPYPDADVNTKVSTDGLEPGKVATYTCDKEYELFGSSSRTCNANGKWSDDIPMCATNVAWKKPATQSSTVRGGNAENANDGDLTAVHDGNKCTETQKEDSPWWSVDLLQEFEISHIRITTRGCCGVQEVQDLEVRVGYSASIEQLNRLCAWYPGTIESGSTKELKCARPMKGRYVSVQMVGVVGSLSLCEVQVFSKEEISKDRCKGDLDVSQLGLFNRTCYEFQITSGGTFEIARNYCEKRREGSLVQGIQPITQKFLISELERLRPQMPTKMVWIGVQKEPQFVSRTWRWVDGSKVESPAWGKEQPNNYNGEQNCVVLDGTREWLWNDVGCNLNYLYWLCQFQPTCGTPDRKLNTTLQLKEEGNALTAVYACPVGHKIEGDKSRTCSATGFWSGESPSCKYVNCKNPPSTDHGVVSLVDSRSTHGARAVYVCAENYTMDGNNTVTCGDQGKWEPRIPNCLYSWCPELKNLENGVLISSGRRSGDVATFTCNPGFFRVGPETLSCILGGKWSGTPPTCQFIDCGLPETLENGKMTLVNSTTFVDSVAVYSCDEDYWLNGGANRICQSNGVWSGEIPKCERISCDEPQVPEGGYVTGYSYDVHSKIDYHCDPGHFITGNLTRVCMRDSTWSGKPATCTFVDCGHVHSLMYGRVIYDSKERPTYLGSEVHYECSTNYRLIGSEVRVCQQSGLWTGSAPRCEEIRCPNLKHPKKSRVTLTENGRRIALAVKRASYKISSQVVYTCERGHIVDGLNIRICLNNGTWSSAPPKCKYVDCGQPVAVERGSFRLLSNETSYGSLVAYECEQNWKINGKVRRKCLSNGTWSGSYPKCVEVLCPSLSKELETKYKEADERYVDPWNKVMIANKEKEKELRVLVDDENRSVGKKAVYRCLEGRRVVGEKERMCQQHGIWGGEEPKCEWIYCQRPSDIENGRVHLLNDNLKFGAVVEHFCVPNFRLHGPFNRTCAGQGNWSGDEPKCLADDIDLGAFDDNTIDGSSNLARGAIEEEMSGASYTGIYVGLAVSLILVLGVGLSLLFFKRRERQLAKSAGDSNSSTKPIDSSRPTTMNYGDLNDPTTGNNIYEYIPEDMDNSSSYTNMSSPTSFTPSPSSYANHPSYHTYSNQDSSYGGSEGYERSYANSSPTSSRLYENGGTSFNNGRAPPHISKRPRMPPPQPPQLPAGVPSSAGVTVNGVAVNT